MGEKSSGHVKMDVPNEIYQSLREVAEMRGQTMAHALADIVQQERVRAVEGKSSKRFASFEERQRAIAAEADAVNKDLGQLEVLQEWEGTATDDWDGLKKHR